MLIGMFGSLSQRRAEASERKHAALGGVGRPAPVAALFARAAAPATVYAAVATEVGRLLGIRDVTMFRYEDDGTATVVAAGSTGQGSFPVGARLPLEGVNVASPIVVDGRGWGR